MVVQEVGIHTCPTVVPWHWPPVPVENSQLLENCHHILKIFNFNNFPSTINSYIYTILYFEKPGIVYIGWTWMLGWRYVNDTYIIYTNIYTYFHWTNTGWLWYLDFWERTSWHSIYMPNMTHFKLLYCLTTCIFVTSFILCSTHAHPLFHKLIVHKENTYMTRYIGRIRIRVLTTLEFFTDMRTGKKQ